MILSRNEITAIINTVWDGVCQSKTGPIVKEDESGLPQIQVVAYNTFLGIVQKVMPMDMQGVITNNETEEKCEVKINQKKGDL